MQKPQVVLTVGFVLILCLVFFSGFRYLEQPPLAYTGGFGEPTCHYCHFDMPINDPGGTIEIIGLPETYLPGEIYQVKLSVKHEQMKRAGFQVSSRYGSGFSKSKQAGKFIVKGSLLAISSGNGINYISHTKETSSIKNAGRTEWIFIWQAPNNKVDDIVFHIAVNAANDDNSEFSDFIYTLEKTIIPN